MLHNITILVPVLLAGLSCATQRTTTTRPANAPPVLQAITYRKSGGLAGLNEWVTITPAGHLQLTGRLSGEHEADLDATQRQALAAAFAGWDQLHDEYLPDRPAPDGLTLYIQYGPKAVTVTEPAPVPPAFRAAVTAIESLTRDLPRKR